MKEFYQYNESKMSLDLNLISLYRVKGQEAPFLPGVLAQNPPRHAARGRENDRLLIYLHLGGNVAFSAAEYAQVTAKLAERFYASAGSLTFALKTSVEALNSVLAERNMRSTGQGKYIIGALVLAALRGDLLYLVQSGPTRAIWLGAHGQKTFHDPALAGKGLGLSQTARMYFAQAQLSPADRLLFCVNFPPEWEAALIEERGPASLESTRRRLTIVTQANLNAVLLQAAEGAGETRILRPAPQENLGAEKAPESAAPESAAPPDSTPLSEAPVSAAAPAEAQNPPPPESAAPESADFTESLPARPRPVLAPAAIPRRERSRRPAPLLSEENRQTLSSAGRRAARYSAQLIQSARQASHASAAWLEKYSPRLLPGAEENEPSPAASWPMFAALLVPVLILTMALVIYSEKGRPAQYQTYYNHAIEAAMQTIHTSDPAELRVRWKASLDWLDKAEAYQQTDDSRRLRAEAQNALDSLDRIQRVDFRPAFASPLNASLRVTHMAASDIDLYLLNDVDGKVLRGALSGSLYELQNFDCGPGTYDGISVGPLVDMIALPRTTPNGITLMGVDAAANLLYCSPGAPPTAARLQPPNTGWKGVADMAYDAGTLYLLDPQNNAIWFYYGQAGVNFPDPPSFFFQQEVPNMKDALGMEVNGDDLYVLHRDGHLTMCTLSRISSSPTHCSDPATLVDTRLGFTSGSTLADGIFSQIQFTGAPDPALVMLEPFSRAVFRFAPRTLELQNQLRARPGKADPLPADLPITATTLSPNKSLFLFINGQVYFADKLP
ncbi:MAG: hypothetical protein Fur0035_03570 [Anaerolineales bacterium]